MFNRIISGDCRETIKVSVVIPAYNEEKRIGQPLTALKEYFPESEIIVVDDGSADFTMEVAEKAGCRVVNNLSLK